MNPNFSVIKGVDCKNYVNLYAITDTMIYKNVYKCLLIYLMNNKSISKTFRFISFVYSFDS